ncbi:MAG: TonB-dependent receptor, partial [Gammaproteobacteria bacterium]|nr:TonB-dependent receptor [Gammaproteobacteria bacterium]
GTALARGLAIGGPYRVESADSSAYISSALDDIYVALGETEVVNLGVAAVTAGTMEEVMVTATQRVQDLRIGAGTDFNRDTIDGIPSVARDFVSTIATDPSILVDNSVARGPAVSIAGQNFRYNSVTIDGVAQNDNFGLSKNASATQRSPISIDAIEAINVNVAPFDVTYGGFIGGNINIVTKSGTNEFHGGVFAFKTDDGQTGNKSKGQNLGIGNFDEETYGFTLGGPIIKDKLFFFINYEKFETTRPANAQTIGNIVGVTQADVDRAIDIFQTEYGFDPGRFATTDTDEDEKTLIKIDWSINDDHRAVFSYQQAEGDVLFDDFTTAATLNSSRYNINEKMDAYGFKWFANWNDRLSSEFKWGSKSVENRQVSIDSSTPAFQIFTPAGGIINAGGDQFRHNNLLDNDSDIYRLKFDYALEDHLLTFGYESEEKSTANTFVPFTRGQYLFFGGLDALEAREIGLVLYGNSTTGNPFDATGQFTLTTNSFFLQDEWTPRDDLTLKFGIRVDENENSDPIPYNPAFDMRNGFANTFNLDGNKLVMPRFGFDWAVNDRLTLRGGAGLFGGGEPLIMLSNSYAGNAITRNIVCGPCIGAAFGFLPELAAALPGPDGAFTFLQEFNGVNPDAAVEAIDPNFDTLSTWKYTVGVDYTADLSAIGLGDEWDFSAEIIRSEVKDGYNVTERRRSVVGSAPDGRPIYDLPADGDYVLENTSQGGGTVMSFNIAKTWDTDNAGRFDWTFGYTNTDMDEIRAYNRFITYESFAFDATTDYNNMGLSTSKYEITDRVVSTFNWEKEIFGDNTSRISLIYTGRTGRNFSYVMGNVDIAFGGTFLADFGSEGDNPGSQLFYVPTGVSDPLVTGDADFLSDLDSFISSNDCLAGFRGRATTRNSCTTGFTNIWSIRFLQEIGIGDSGNKLELILDIENFGNLLNDDWGRVESYTAPSNVPVANVAISEDGSQYIYSPTGAYAGNPQSVVPQPEIALLPSVYRIQLGLRYRF